MIMPSNYQRGLLAEYVSQFWMRCKGYRSLFRRFKTKVGEIDLIMVKGKCLVFIEVKSRNSYERAAEALTSKQKNRLIRAGQFFIARFPKFQEYAIRFDIILVTPWRLQHIENAWFNDE
jgi:putative endonuclease